MVIEQKVQYVLKNYIFGHNIVTQKYAYYIHKTNHVTVTQKHLSDIVPPLSVYCMYTIDIELLMGMFFKSATRI